MEDLDTGATVMENDLTKADFDVVADVGPSSTSRRASTVRALSALLQSTQDPETRAVSPATSPPANGYNAILVPDLEAARERLQADS